MRVGKIYSISWWRSGINSDIPSSFHINSDKHKKKEKENEHQKKKKIGKKIEK